MLHDQTYLRRCFDLARLGAETVSPNPMVGAVLVAENRIIGEGFHRKPGEPHAEVRALESVHLKDKHLIPFSTLYVSLEPCNFFGRTPPCTELIIKNNIKRVVISSLDYSPEVSGKGMIRLREAGVDVTLLNGLKNGEMGSQIRNHFVVTGRPWVVLKFARSRDGFIGQPEKQVWLSNALSKRLVHRWRATFDAIMVGTETARIDNPRLTNRLYPGPAPLRIIPDRAGRLSADLHIMDGAVPTWILTRESATRPADQPNLSFVAVPEEKHTIPYLMELMASNQLTSLLVEGGARLLNSFIEYNLWDEARIIDTPVYLGQGIQGPIISGQELESFTLQGDRITVLKNQHNPDLSC